MLLDLLLTFLENNARGHAVYLPHKKPAPRETDEALLIALLL